MARMGAESGRRQFVQRLRKAQSQLRSQREFMAAIRAADLYRTRADTLQKDLEAMRRSLRASRDRFGDLYDFAPIGYLTLDQSGIIEDLNLTSAALFNIHRGRAVGMPLFSFVAEADRPLFLDHMARARSAELAVTELNLRPRDSAAVSVQLRTKAWGSAGATEHLYPTAITDLTEIRSAEAERLRLLKQTEDAMAASRAKDRFLAMLSHELRTPLTPVMAVITSSALNEAVPPHLRYLLDIARHSVEMEVRLINDLLDFTRIGQAKMRVEKVAADLHQLVHEVVQMCDSEMREKQLQLSLALQARHHQVEADPPRMRQVFSNLLRNAIKFTPRGNSIFIRSANLGTDRITVSVRDTELGIDPTKLQQLFEPFVQLEDSSMRQGLGLGLTICKALVTAHHGTITAYSEGPGRGATFEVTLATVADSNDASGSAAALPSSPHAASSNGGPSVSRPLRIMLVEDHRDTAKLMSRVLARGGHVVEVANTVAAALELARQPFDVVISDLCLPDGDGCELMRQLAPRGFRGIALSGLASDDDANRCRDAGFARHLSKPVDMQTLLKAIADVASGYRDT